MKEIKLDEYKNKKRDIKRKKITTAITIVIITIIAIIAVLYISNAEFRNFFDKYIFRKEVLQEDVKFIEIKPEDKKTLLAFYKACWEISGTEEWKNALKEAKELTEIYLEKGIEGITNPDVRARLEIWENQWNLKHKK